MKEHQPFLKAVAIRATKDLTPEATEEDVKQAILKAMQAEIEYEAEMVAGETDRAKDFQGQIAKCVWHRVRVESALTCNILKTIAYGG